MLKVMMRTLHFPPFPYQLQHQEGGRYAIFDNVRKKYVPLTSEEWVRQHLVHYLTKHLDYPSSLLRLEQVVQHGGRSHRPDLVVYNATGTPCMIIECKAPEIPIDISVLQQASRYNASFQARWIVLTNGRKTLCWQIDYVTGKHKLHREIPKFNQIKS